MFPSVVTDTINSFLMNNELKEQQLEMFHYTEHHSHNIENDIDPENNFSHISEGCIYFTEDQFNGSIDTENTVHYIYAKQNS